MVVGRHGFGGRWVLGEIGAQGMERFSRDRYRKEVENRGVVLLSIMPEKI